METRANYLMIGGFILGALALIFMFRVLGREYRRAEATAIRSSLIAQSPV